jgi:hypothetical protein
MKRPMADTHIHLDSQKRRRRVLFLSRIAVCLLLGCSRLAADREAINISLEDLAFLENIVTTLSSLRGKYETRAGPSVGTATGSRQVDIDVFSGERSVFLRLGKVVGEHPLIAHRVIATLVECLDDMRPTAVTYKNHPVPLGILCYEALHSIAYYEAADENGDLIGWEGVVLPAATEAELKIAKNSWQKVLAEKSYSLL